MQSYRFNAGREHLPDIVTDFWKGVYHFFTGSFFKSACSGSVFHQLYTRASTRVECLDEEQPLVRRAVEHALMVAAGITR